MTLHPKVNINLIGYVSGNLGLGVAARGIAKAAAARGFVVNALDLDSGDGRTLQGATDSTHVTFSRIEDLPGGINVFVLPPHSAAEWLGRNDDLLRLLGRPDCMNALFPFWELSVFPPTWLRVMELFDAVVAPSGFIEGALDFALSGTRVFRGLTPVELPPGVEADRARFGLPEDAFLAVCSFDPLSDPQRKNPQAAIEAFSRAFRSHDRARLVVKLNVPAGGFSDTTRNRTVLQPLLDMLRSDPRTLVISETLSYRDVLSLYASADVFLSLHRSEGLGLGLLESMGLGKPVVATGWSGNKLFMSAANACPVRHHLVPIKATHVAYTAALAGLRPFWAEPDIDDAAAWLRRLEAEPALRQDIGAAARRAFLRYQSEAAELGFLDDLVALHRHQQVHSPRPSEAMRRQRVADVQRQVRLARLSEWKRLKLRVHQQFSRHVGWRFAGRNRAT